MGESSPLFEILQSHVLTLFSSHSSTWDVSDSRWHPRACGFVMRVGTNPRIGVRSRGRPRRVGATAVRTGILVLHVRLLRHDRDIRDLRSETLHPSQSHLDFLCSFTMPIFSNCERCCTTFKKSMEGTYNVFTLHLGKQRDNSIKIMIKKTCVRILYTPSYHPLFPSIVTGWLGTI